MNTPDDDSQPRGMFLDRIALHLAWYIYGGYNGFRGGSLGIHFRSFFVRISPILIIVGLAVMYNINFWVAVPVMFAFTIFNHTFLQNGMVEVQKLISKLAAEAEERHPELVSEMRRKAAEEDDDDRTP